MSLMRGAHTARDYVTTYLADTVPDMLVVARQQWELDEWELPDPETYDSYDPLTVDRYPAIGSITRRTRSWRRTDIDDFAQESYDAVYDMTVFLWCRTPLRPDNTWAAPAYDAALRLRDDLLAVVRGCLLRTPSLNHPGYCRLNENSLTEDYLDAIKVSSEQAQRWAAGGTLSFELQLTETAYQAQVGSADTIVPDTARLV